MYGQAVLGIFTEGHVLRGVGGDDGNASLPQPEKGSGVQSRPSLSGRGRSHMLPSFVPPQPHAQGVASAHFYPLGHLPGLQPVSALNFGKVQRNDGIKLLEPRMDGSVISVTPTVNVGMLLAFRFSESIRTA